MSFTHLHVHSHYSLLNGLTQIKPLVKTAKERGFSALALTDTGAMYGAIEFYQACLKEGIKPILGFEAYLAPRSRHDKDFQLDKETSRLVLLAENYDGYRNLMMLSSIGHLEGFFDGVPRIDREILKQYSNHLIALSGSIHGSVGTLLKLGDVDGAKKEAELLNTIFGQNNFYLELQDHAGIEGMLDVNTKSIQLSQETGIPLVVTRDVHYLNIEDAEAQDVLVCIGKGWKVGQHDREDLRHVDRSMNTEEDIVSRFRHVPEAIENTEKIAERVNIEIALDNWHFAPVELPTGKTADDFLREEAYQYVGAYYPEVTDELKARMEYELDIIKTKGYSPYFICVADYVRYAKQNGIVESTRGSAAGSVVSYVLGITTVDPIRFKLPFERFLNPYRPSPPDIDTDFADDRREEMIEYVTKKYGADKVAQIITFGTMAARASVRDVGRALGLSYSFCDQVAKLIPMGAQGFPMTIERALKEEPDLKKLFETNADVKRLLDLAQKVEGCARHTSIHAAGVVISPTPLTDFTPVQRETGGDKIITQYEMHAVESAGVLKNDFLGIRNLAILGNAVEIVKATTGEEVDIYHLPLDDKTTFEMLARGETMGTFQLGGSGMTRWLKELKPSTIDDIMAMVALYRPGPMDVIPEYIRRKHNPETIQFMDPRMEEYLQASFGLLVYQDDVMLTAIKLAGYDWMDADKFRKAMGKKIPEEMAKQKVQFYDGCKKFGKLEKALVDELWRAIEPFAAYGFNKAHAASYGIVAYQTSYMKAHYPVQYMAAVLRAEFGDAEKVSAIVGECRRMGIEVLPPDVNESFRNFAMVSKPGESGRIRFGLTAIKNVGGHICEVIYRERKDHGAYASLENFLERAQDKDLNKRSLESMIQAGALDCFGIDRGVLNSNLEYIVGYVKEHRDQHVTNQDSLFANSAIALGSKVTLKSAHDATLDQKLIWEKKLLGLYISSHPFLVFADTIGRVVIPLADVASTPRDGWVKVGGVVESVKKKMTKKGDHMLFVTLADMSGSMEMLVFPKTFQKTQDVWQEGAVVCIVGKTPKEEGDNKIFVENAYALTEENVEDVARFVGLGNIPAQPTPTIPEEPSIVITLSQDALKQHTDTLKTLFTKHSGAYRVILHVGDRKIRTETRIMWKDDIQKDIEAIVGAGNVAFFGEEISLSDNIIE